MILKSMVTALIIAFALLLAVATLLSEYISDGMLVPIFTVTISIALFISSAFLHRKTILDAGATPALLWLLVWLGVFMVVFPNIAMMLLLYGKSLGAVVAPAAILVFLFGSLYYLIPSGIFGEQLFLQETVISPLGMTGIWASVLFWGIVVTVTVFALHLVAGRRLAQSHKKDR